MCLTLGLGCLVFGIGALTMKLRVLALGLEFLKFIFEAVVVSIVSIHVRTDVLDIRNCGLCARTGGIGYMGQQQHQQQHQQQQQHTQAEALVLGVDIVLLAIR